MDVWHCIAERNDVIRRWAELEGKSAQMRAERYQQKVPATEKPSGRRSFAAALHLVCWLVELWWKWHSG